MHLPTGMAQQKRDVAQPLAVPQRARKAPIPDDPAVPLAREDPVLRVERGCPIPWCATIDASVRIRLGEQSHTERARDCGRLRPNPSYELREHAGQRLEQQVLARSATLPCQGDDEFQDDESSNTIDAAVFKAAHGRLAHVGVLCEVFLREAEGLAEVPHPPAEEA